MSLGRILGALFGTASGKGYIGESRVSVSAWFRLPSSTYKPFRDVTLPTPNGTTQIDHIFVSRFGVFVVETKTMGGWIFGGERDQQWTQMFLGGKKFRFQNPLRQNYRHVKAVEAILVDLKLPRDAVHSVVAFVGDAQIKTEMPANVTVGTGFASYIRSFSKPMLSDEAVVAACRAIESRSLPSSGATNRQHVRDLKKQQRSGTPGRCPRCGKEMVLHTTRRGPNSGRQFWGCSGFPACRYIRKMGA